MLFVAHRQELQGRGYELKMAGVSISPSISQNVKRLWDTTSDSDTRALKNGVLWQHRTETQKASKSLPKAFEMNLSLKRRGPLLLFHALRALRPRCERVEPSFLSLKSYKSAEDKQVALFGRNAFFLQKPAAFHDSCASYARTAAVLHVLLWLLAGPGALIYLLIAEASQDFEAISISGRAGGVAVADPPRLWHVRGRLRHSS